jgi:hypothetical protein
MVPLAALQARPLEVDMRCGIHGGNSTLATGLDQRVKESPKPDKMSFPPARHNCLVSGRTTYLGIPV